MAIRSIMASLSNVTNKETGELVSVRLVALESSRGITATYELPYILHALGRPDVRMPAVENNKFTYKFPFKLS
ncbi:MAG: hypothetical protein ACOCOG_04375 [Prevotella sp.]